MNCKSVDSRLSAYLDSELPGNEMLEIRAHLSLCQKCQMEEAQLKVLKRHLALMEEVEIPDHLADRLSISVLSQQRSQAGAASVFSQGVFVLAVAGLAMASTLAVLSFSTRRPVSQLPVTRHLSSPSDPEFEVERDRIFSTMSDPTAGVPVMGSPAGH